MFLSLAPDNANTKFVSAKGKTGESLVKKINFVEKLLTIAKTQKVFWQIFVVAFTQESLSLLI